ncbi:MAG TPA: GspH/FimT family pseudopilin [Rhodanobacteraceae bacterium]|nr:GspH/FimT family pseudopilin [Rhodanobacteraceae bacterium]
MAAYSHTRQQGLTLIELLIVLSIAAILAMIGMPALGSMLARSHRQSVEGALQASLMHAREAAITRHMPVIVCPSPDHHTCASWDDWQDGWLIAADADRDREPDAGAPLAVFDAMPAQMRVLSSSGRPRIVFHPDGSAAGTNAQLTVCHLGDAGEGLAVVVANSGRVRTADAQPDRLRDCLGK